MGSAATAGREWNLGFKEVDREAIVVSVATEPMPSDREFDETEIFEIEVKKKNSMKEQG